MKAILHRIVIAFFAILISSSIAFAGDSPFNPDISLVEAPTLYKECEGNKFAFNKKYNGQRIGIAGEVSKIDEATFQQMDMRGKKIPYILLKGLVRAYIATNDLDLSAIMPGDIAFFDCTQVSSDDMPFYVKAMCRPALTGRDNKRTWVTDDHDVQDFLFSKQTIQNIRAQQK